MKAAFCWISNGLFIGEDPIMNKIMSCLGGTNVVVAFAVIGIVPAIGAPINLPMKQIAHPSEITYVDWHGGGWHGGGWYPGGYHGGRHPGYGGYYGDDFLVAGGALLLGALVGSAIVNSAYQGDRYYQEDRYPHRYRRPYYSHRYSYTPYISHHGDPYLGWQRGF